LTILGLHFRAKLDEIGVEDLPTSPFFTQRF